MLRKAIKNVSFLWMGSILGAIISFVTQAILAKSLGTEFYGLFSAALATINLIVPLAGFGVAAFWLKAFGQEGWGATRWLIPSFKFTFISSSILFLLMLTWSIQGPNDSNTARLLVILSVMLYGLSLQELFFSKLQLEEKYSSYALWQLFIPLFRFVSIYTLAIKNSLSIENVAIIYIVPSIISLLVSFFYMKKMYSNNFELKGHGERPVQKLSIENKTTKELVICCWVFGASGFFYILWNQSNVVILKYMVDDHSAGLYNVAVLIINAICILPTVIYTKYLLPKVHRWAKNDLEQLKKLYHFGNKFMLRLGFFSVVGIWLLSEIFIKIAFGNEYVEAAQVLMGLSFLLPIRFIGHNVGALLVVNDYMIKKIKVMGFVATMSILLNFILVTKIGIFGLVITSIICEIILVSCYYYLVRNIYIKNNWSEVISI